MIFFDGHYFETESEVPDLGSFEASNENPLDKRRDYFGLAADVSKLPTYDDLLSGSTALCVDNGSVYVYLASNQTWYKQTK